MTHKREAKYSWRRRSAAPVRFRALHFTMPISGNLVRAVSLSPHDKFEPCSRDLEHCDVLPRLSRGWERSVARLLNDVFRAIFPRYKRFAPIYPIQEIYLD